LLREPSVLVLDLAPHIAQLYELEQLLDEKTFVRISKSEIINLRFVKRLDLSITGTIGIQLKTGETAYVSRRYVNRIKSILGL
ncbi:MAG: LytTR family DNA-binding domain-containing protein, partial [Ruminococcus sp.]